MKKATRIFVILISLSTLATAQINDQFGRKVVSSDSLSKKEAKAIIYLKNGGYKIDMDSLRSGKIVLRTDGLKFIAPLMKSKKFTMVALGSNGGLSLNGKELKTQFINQFDSSKYAGSKTFKKKFKASRKGKKRFIHNGNRVKWFIDFGNLEPKYFTYKFEFRYKNKPIGALLFTKINGEIALELEQQENAPCVPLDRYTFFFNHLTDLSAEVVKPKKYKFKDGKSYSKRFELTFEKNSAEFKFSEVERINQYLAKENLDIKGAKIMAFASIEGDSTKNTILQLKRADVLWMTLGQANVNEFPKSVTTSERWIYFYHQLKMDSISEFEGLSKEEIKALFEDKSVQKKYEYLLKDQRKAFLALKLYKKYSIDDKLAILRRDIIKLDNQVYKTLNIWDKEVRRARLKKLAHKLVAIELAVDEYAREGLILQDDIEDNFDFTVGYFHEWRMLRFYTLKRELEKGNWPYLTSVEGTILAALESSLSNISSSVFSNSNIALRQAADVQTFAYELIKKGDLDPSFYHQLSFSDDEKYYHLALNKLNFKNENESLIPIVEQDKKTARLGNLSISTSSYYFLIKKRVQGEASKVDKFVSRWDQLYHWDLYDFLWYNIHGWEVWGNKFFDPEIEAKEMDAYLATLFAAEHNICPDNLYQLAIDFHLKVLQSAAELDKPNKQFTKSYKFMSSYYRKNARKLDGKTAYDISAQLVFLNNLFYRNEPIKAADKIMQVAWQENLMDKRKEYFYSDVHWSLR